MGSAFSESKNDLGSEVKQEKGGLKFKSVIEFLESLSPGACRLHSMVTQIAKLVLVMSATNSLSERACSAIRHMKNWLRSTMNQSRLNWCMILHIHTNENDKVDLTATANEFTDRNFSQQSILGEFL